MKKTLSFMVMAFALLFTQCRKPEVKFPTPSAADEGTTVSMTVTAGPGSKTDITTAGGITWSTGDKLYVGYDSKYIGCLTLQGAGGSATGTFSGDVTLTGISEGTPQTFHFFYLGSDNIEAPTYGAESVEVSFAEQEIYADANNKLVNASKYHVGYGSAQGTVAGSEVTGINVTLVSKVALARFSFKKSGTSEGYSGALTLSGANIYNSMTVGFGGTFNGTKTGGGEINLTNTTSSEKYVMLVPAGATAATLNFGGEYEGFTELAQGIEANKYYGQGGPIDVVLTKALVPVTGVSLNKTSLSLTTGSTETLTATVAPANATNKRVTWSSDNTGVATVSTTGKVTAVAAGEATITVTTDDGGKTATCTVTVPHEYVDFGLSSGTLWATCNVGASKPEEFGDYYAWGEVLPYYADGHSQDNPCNTWRSMTTGAGNTDLTSGYAWESYSQGGESGFAEWTQKPYNDNILTSTHDAATANWGGGWRMPTTEEWQELYSNTNCTWTTENGVYGRKFTDKKNNTKYIFLPAAGDRNGTDLRYVGTDGFYWSRTLYSSGTDRAYRMTFNSGPVTPQSFYSRWGGYSVRPVRSAR